MVASKDLLGASLYPQNGIITEGISPSQQALPGIQDTLQLSSTASNPKELSFRPMLAPPGTESIQNPISAEDLEERFHACVEIQRQSRIESSQLAQERMLQQQEIKKAIRKKIHETEDKAIGSQKNAKTLEWTGYVLGGGIAVTLITSLIFTIATGGASLILGTLEAGLLIAKGINDGVKGWYDYKSNESTAELYGLREQRSQSHRKIEEHARESTDALKQVNDYFSMQKKALQNHMEASRFQI